MFQITFQVISTCPICRFRSIRAFCSAHSLFNILNSELNSCPACPDCPRCPARPSCPDALDPPDSTDSTDSTDSSDSPSCFMYFQRSDLSILSQVAGVRQYLIYATAGRRRGDRVSGFARLAVRSRLCPTVVCPELTEGGGRCRRSSAFYMRFLTGI